MSWRVALIDSCGEWPGAIDAAAFAADAATPAGAPPQVECRPTVADPSGHGSRIARLFTGSTAAFELLLGQVFLDNAPTTGAVIAAAIDWAVGGRADLIHMSLGLEADRAVLAASVRRAIDSRCIVVASTPARGKVVYPAAYAGVIRATGDARCAPGELSCLGPLMFGGCPRFAQNVPADSGAGVAVGGASAGAAWVTRNILSAPKQGTAGAVAAALTAAARYLGPERRGAVPAGRSQAGAQI